MRTTLVLAVALALAAAVHAVPCPTFNYTGNSHYEFGYQYGLAFRDAIRERYSNSDSLQKTLIPWQRTSAGAAVYDAFLRRHEQAFPAYLQELRGIANATGIPFHVHFLQNLEQEFSYFAKPSSEDPDHPFVDHCSDYVVHTAENALIGHNEDGGPADFRHTALIRAKIGDGPTFTTFVYLGDLCTGAWGFNSYGIAFTMNRVTPTNALRGGIGRIFVARRLLEAQTLEAAIQIVTMKGQTNGHNYQIGETKTERLVNVEVATDGVNVVTPLPVGVQPFFHPNIYLNLNVSQVKGPSSLHRLERVAQLPKPQNAADILQILGDQVDADYPIFHDGSAGDKSNGWTLVTVLHDIKAKTSTLYDGNPRQQKELMKLNIA